MIHVIPLNRVYIAMCLFLFCLIAIPAFGVGINANIYSTNNYYARALGIQDPHIQYDFGLSSSVGKLAITVSPWVSYNLGKKEVNEVDYIMDFTYPISESFSESVGFIYYDVTEAPETSEIYIALASNSTIGKAISISPGIKFYYDVREIKKAYIEALLSLGVPAFPYISFLSVVGYDTGQFKPVEKSKMTTLQLNISGKIPMKKGMTIIPSFTYVIGLKDYYENTGFAGVKIGFGF